MTGRGFSNGEEKVTLASTVIIFSVFCRRFYDDKIARKRIRKDHFRGYEKMGTYAQHSIKCRLLNFTSYNVGYSS